MDSTKSSAFLRTLREALGRASTIEEEEGTESGFTLIELMVVLLIMAILMAIAIPTFLGVKNSANDRAAQSNLTNAITSAKAQYINNQTYGATAASLANAMNSSTGEPEFNFVTGAASYSASGAPQISVYVGPSGCTTSCTIAVMATQASTGSASSHKCWVAEDNNSGSTDTDGALQGVSYNEFLPGNGSCSAATADATPSASWGQAWSTSYPNV